MKNIIVLTCGLKGLAARLCPVPIAPIFSLGFFVNDVLVTGLTLLMLGDDFGTGPTGTTEGFHVRPPLKTIKSSKRTSNNRCG